MLRVGLTGGIACGKSRVLERLARAGCLTIDLDEVSRDVLAPGRPAHAEVIAAFGPVVCTRDGAVDRRALAAIVFSDENARLRLNAIVHPHIRAEEARRINQLSMKQDAVVVTDGALLVETGAHLRYERLIVVHCEPEIQIARLMRRDRLDRGHALRRIATQMPLDEKLRFASYDIDTSGDCGATDRRIDQVFAGLCQQLRDRGSATTLSRARAMACLRYAPQIGPACLRPVDVLNEAVVSGYVDLHQLARRMQPPHDGPWYLAAERMRSPEPGPETLTAPIVVWVLSQGWVDCRRALAAAASLARLTHLHADAIAGACLLAEALCDAAVGESRADPVSWPCWRREANKWGSGEPPKRILQAVDAALEHGAEIESATNACAAIPYAAKLAAAIVAMKIGASPAALDPAWSEPLRRIGFED